MTIVTTHYRYMRPPRKKKAKAADIAAPVIVRAGKKAPVAATNGDDRKSAIVTAKNPRRRHGRFGDVPDMTPEEHNGSYVRSGSVADHGGTMTRNATTAATA